MASAASGGRCEVRLGRLRECVGSGCVEGGGVGVCWCSRPLVGQQVPSRGIKLGRCGGPIDMVAAVEAPATGWRAAVA